MVGIVLACASKVFSDRNEPYTLSLLPEQMALITLFWPVFIVISPFFLLTWFYKKIF